MEKNRKADVSVRMLVFERTVFSSFSMLSMSHFINICPNKFVFPPKFKQFFGGLIIHFFPETG